jgi:hypothetical protein
VPRNVAIVLEPDYSVRLEKLAFHTPVWIVDTPPNRAAAELAWRKAVEWPHITVTLFRTNEEWKTLLRQIDLIERAVDVVEVIGSELTDEARTALTKLGFEKFDDTSTGFRAAKPRR